jgi:6-phosphogluconolactonase
MAVELSLEVLEDPEAVARRAARYFAAEARAAVAARASFSAAISGGRTPWRMFELLGEEDLPWGRIDLYQADERVAPAGDPDRSMTHLGASLPRAALERLHPMPVEDQDVSSSAERYAEALPARLDLVHLGLGPDGHTASLIPGDPVLEVTDRTVAISGPYQGRLRMTLTYPPLDGSGQIMWLVTGGDKPDALVRLMSRDTSIPAARVQAPRQTVFADRAAAARLT